MHINKIMGDINGVDILGYSAMVVLLVSFLMKKVKTLRLVNTLGCILFATWGTLIQEWPVVITNVSIIFINLYYLLKKPS